MKKINPKVLENQNKYNDAFNRWKASGYPVPSADYQIIFNCIYEAAKGVIRSSVVKWDDEADGKALDLTFKIIERDEIGKHYKIDSLGAYLGVCKLEFTISKKVQFYDKQRSYEEIIEKGYDAPEEEKKEDILDKTFYAIEDEGKIKNYKIEDIKNPDTLFEILFRMR